MEGFWLESSKGRDFYTDFLFLVSTCQSLILTTSQSPIPCPLRPVIRQHHAPWSLCLKVELTSTMSLSSMSMTALLDSSTTGLFIDKSFCLRHNIEMLPLDWAVQVHNIHSSLKKMVSSLKKVHTLLQMGQHTKLASLAITKLGHQSVIIGHSWLSHHNPEINWATQEISLSYCPSSCNSNSNGTTVTVEDIHNSVKLEEGNTIYAVCLPDNYAKLCTTIAITQTPSQKLVQEALGSEGDIPLATIPSHYLDFTDIFSKEAFSQLPPWKKWDHAIDLIPNKPLPKGKTFPLSLPEQKELDTFLKENLDNGCIWPLKSPIGAPVFFVKKTDRSLKLVQDYHKLNEITIKNSYPLPLISDVLSRLRKAHWFSTLDPHWGFNNVQVKENNEWKAAFSTNCSLFEPLIMFFGLCNLPVTFQTMMNKVLCPFIDRNVAIWRNHHLPKKGTSVRHND